MQKFLLPAALLLAALNPLSGQNFWNSRNEADIPLVGERRVVPLAYQTARLDVAGLAYLLAQAPERFSPSAENTAALPVLVLPTPEGRTARFRLLESPVMHPDLQAQYPETRCYTGQGVDDPSAFLKCDLTPWGFHAMVRGGSGDAWFIDPYSHGDRENYVVYYKKDLVSAPLACGVDALMAQELPQQQFPNAEQGDCQLRRYRLALAGTGEYTATNGGTVALGLAAMNTSINRVNGVFEDDLSLTLQLVANNNLIVYTNAATDPYTNGDIDMMFTQNQTTCDAQIGSANYDTGHVIGTGGGGAAYNATCFAGFKAQAATLGNPPSGAAFDIDYLAHEMGHQFDGQHSFNNTTAGSCNGNDNPPTAMEPGSGSTIMSYAGICSPHNVQNNSDAYFHAASIEEISDYMVTGFGSTCDQIINTGNGAPAVNAGSDYTIPRSTPFALTAAGNDPNGDAITYCWEQMDNATAVYPLANNNPQGPNFRSFSPTASPTRFFPRLADIISNANPNWEKLPSVNRTLNFRVTVRDNAAAYGCTGEDDMVVTVVASAGPFAVTAPNTAVSFSGGSNQTVTWNVANTTASPVSCANVKISLSTDGGNNFPTVLLASTPNDGSQSVTLPNINSTTCRIKVECADNIFFDMSNANFTITAVAPVELLDFSVRAAGKNQAQLQWATATESNNRGFEVELKGSADADFRSVGFVAGKGNSTEKQQYQFTASKLPEDDYLFRLRQMDHDGQSSLSPIRSLRLRPDFTVALFPNPLQGSVLNLTVLSAREASLTFELFNAQGQRVATTTYDNIAEGRSTLRLPTEALPAGLYHYVCRSGDATAQGKLVVRP